MVTQTLFQHVLELDLEINSIVHILEEGIEFINEANNENPDPELIKLLELYQKAIQPLKELHSETTDYIV
jgi:hypothetical protein